MPINDVKSAFGLLFGLVAIERRKSGSREGTMNWSFGVIGVYGLPRDGQAYSIGSKIHPTTTTFSLLAPP